MNVSFGNLLTILILLAGYSRTTWSRGIPIFIPTGSGLSVGAIIGIVIGSIVGLIVLIACCGSCCLCCVGLCMKKENDVDVEEMPVQTISQEEDPPTYISPSANGQGPASANPVAYGFAYEGGSMSTASSPTSGHESDSANPYKKAHEGGSRCNDNVSIN